MKTNLLKSIFISLILLVGATNAWAYVTYYLKSDNTTWDTNNKGWGFTHNTTTTTYMANGSKFKLWRTDWGSDGWFGVNNSTLKPGDGGLHFKQYENDVWYNGPSGMVCFHMDQAGNNSDSKPWVWITRPTFYLKHNWSGGSWTWKALTDNQDGTYQLTDYYGGTTLNYGDNNDNNSNGWASVTATTTGTLSNGKKCIFTFNSADKTINITRLYTIKYDGNGSTTGVPSEHDKTHGTNTALSSSIPTRTGYTFAGWNTEADGSGTNYAKGATYSANADVTLCAKWTANTYTVAFNANGGTGSMLNQSYTYGVSKALTENAFTKTGYTFAGWNTKADGTGANYTDKQSVNDLTPTNGATVTLYAKWTANTYTVAFNANGGSGTMSNQNFTYAAAKKALTANDFDRTGYTFAGWNTKADGSGTSYSDQEPVQNLTTENNGVVTLYAQWELETYTITYENLNGASHTNLPTYNINTETITFAAPTTKPTGYTFANWTPASIVKGSTGDVTVTANWTASTSTVTLSQEEATTQGTASVTATYGSAMPNITKPARTGYNFAGYYTGKDGAGTQYYDKDGKSAKNSDLQEDITLYAKWTINSHQLTWEVNGGNELTGDYTSGSVEYGTEIKVPADPTRTGYTFKGWSPSTIDKTMPDKPLTFTAQWTVNTYTITLDPQSGTGGTTSVIATYDAAMPSITIPTAPTGYEFGGYFDGDTKYYNNDGTSAKKWDIANNTTTLHAKWTAIQYRITYENLDGTENNNPELYTIEDAITFNAPSARNGYTFVGWHPASITAGSTGDKTVTAIWKEKDANTVYLRANDMWKADGAKLAVYAWNDSENTWVNFEYDDCTGNILMADIPAKYTGIKFARLNPNPDDNNKGNGYNFANAWNETSDLNIPTDNKNLYDLQNEYIYLKPNSNWRQANARFAARFFKSSGSEEEWKDMTDADGDGYYSCNKPSGYDMVIFCRMNPATKENKWDHRWDQSKDQKIPNNNLFVVDDGQWGGNGNNNSGATGNWDNNHWDNSQWTTYTAPTYTVTINPCENGTITVVCNDQTYTSSTENVTIPNVTIHTELNITFTPADGYILTTPLVTYADVVADNIYSICGPAVISAEFVPQGTTKTIYLRPNDDWLKDDAIFIAHAWKDGRDDQHDYLMTTKDDDYTGSYSCTIDSKYDHVLFARINPEHKDNQELKAEWMWNKTKNLQITDDVLNANGYRFAILNKVGGSGSDKDFYDGKWEENTPIWGLTADFNLWHAEDAIFRGYPGKVDILLHSKTHEFLLYNIKTGEYCHNNGTYTRGNSGQWWSMNINTQDNCKLEADVDRAIYQFQMQYVTQTGTFKKQISITYPNTGVYYLAYQEGDNTKSFRKSHAIDKITEGEKEDIVSFFVNVDESPYIYLLDGSNTILSKHPITETAGEHPNGAMLPGKRNSPTLSIGSGCGVTNSGVYNFVLHQEGNTAQIDAAATHLYTGSYYIRTDASEGGWNDFRQESNQMTYSSYAESHSNFNHYFCKWVESSAGAQSNVKFTIANDYSYSLSDTLNRDNFIIKDQVDEGCLPDSANVRFGWDSRTNEVSRAYIKGSSTKRFLVLVGKDDNLKDKKGDKLSNNEATFIDQNNWIYQVDVTVNNATQVKLIAEYNGHTQYFKGSAEEYNSLLSSTAASSYKIRLVYDFKSNHIVTAMILDGDKEVTTDDALGTDMMVIRKDQGKAEQLTFNPDVKKLSEVDTVYAVMTFTSDWINGSAEPRERSLYWVSFPFDVKIADVFGFGEYAEQWIIQYYDGAERAEKGLFADSGTYWKYIFDTNTTLKAGEGYVLVLDLNKVTFPHGATEVSLYFPSTGPLNTITGELPTEATVPEHWCNIDREWTEDGKTYYHRYTDSHWNLIGVPGFADITGFNVTGNEFVATDPSFYYGFDLSTNQYNVTAGSTNFQAMYAYMVQFAGTIDWSLKSVDPVDPPAAIAARRYNDERPEKVVLRLELAQGKEQADRTFIQLEEEGATAEFDLSRDLTKIINSGANIYTLAGEYSIQTAGNALPMEEAVVPVGVDIATAGEYTFRMPDGTEGMVVELLDYEANTRTNLLLSDYTVTLQKGSCENRFALHIQPQKSGVSTSIENVDEGVNGGEAVMKYLIDGKLFIRTADGVLYDAQGRKL